MNDISKSDELLIANLALPLVKDLILPKVQKLFKSDFKLSEKSKVLEINFEQYLNSKYEKHAVIDTLAFPNKQTLFDVLYEPLVLIDAVKIITKSGPRRRISQTEITIDGYKDNFLPKYWRIIIEDTAGMGKSTILIKLFRSIIEEKIGIPILIPLRQINKKNTFLNEIQSQISPNEEKISINNLMKLLIQGDFIFLLDGFDEISNNDRNFVIKELHSFIEKVSSNYFVLTSRPEDSLTSFGDFRKFIVKPLDEKKAYDLIRRYDRYSYKPIAGNLIEQLDKNDNKSLKEFLENPFLVSLLYKSFDFKKDIPLKKTQFYRQVYDALFEAHDLSKEGYLKRDKYCKLHSDDFERVLRFIGYLTLIVNKVEYDKNYILNLIDKVKVYLPDLNFKSSDYLNDLLSTVPLFKKDGHYYKWAHKSLQDYFAAKFIWIDAKDNQIKILDKIFKDVNNARFSNMLDLFFELDTPTFEMTILYWLLKDFKAHADSFQTSIDIPINLIKRRVENTFAQKCLIYVGNKKTYHDAKNDRTITDLIPESKHLPFLKESSYINNYYFNANEIIVFTMSVRNPQRHSILQIIEKRIPNLVTKKIHDYDQSNLHGLSEDTFYEVDNNPNSAVNQINNYEIINQLTTAYYTINYDKVIKKLEDLEKNVKNTMEDDLIDW